MKDKIIVSDISNGVLVKFANTYKYGGEFAYNLGRKDDVKLLIERFLRILEIENYIEWRMLP